MPPTDISRCRLAAKSAKAKISTAIEIQKVGSTRGRPASATSPTPSQIGPSRRGCASATPPLPGGRSWISGRPSRPHGRTTSTTAITTKISTMAIFGSSSTP